MSDKITADCGHETTPQAEVVVLLRRPSDQTELCSVMSFCPKCAQGWKAGPLPGDEVPMYATRAQAYDWVEAHGHKHNVLWLTA